MSEQMREALSALKDGEAGELELRRLLKHGDSQEVDQHWRAMHQITDTINGRTTEFHDWDISGRVAMAITDEPSHISQDLATPKAVNWYKPVAGFAVAASVAMAVVLGTQTLMTGDAGLNGGASTLANSSRVYPAQLNNGAVGNMAVSASINSLSPVPGTGLTRAVEVGDLAAEQRLHRYMRQHTEQSALNNGQGMINFARVVSFEAP